MNYFAKKDIVSTLKNVSFKEVRYKQECFELDYIFAKSTMYQKVSVNYDTYITRIGSNKYFLLHPKTWTQFFYNDTMGLGYRPFKLAWWILGFMALFAIYYLIKMPDKINHYISEGSPRELNTRIVQSTQSKRRRRQRMSRLAFTDTFINCMYFSALLLFTFRVKRDLLTFFDTKEKRIIVGEWLIGFSIYVAFLTLSKSGSILHTLKSLFVG